jgi:hypothetical protein
MASTIRIKRSGTSGNPATLGAGELAYSYLPDNGSNGGDRLYVGTGTEIAGNAFNHEIIGGKFFTQMLDHAKGTLTPNSAIIVDVNSKIDILKVDDITINEGSITATGGDINFSNITLSGVASPTDSADATNKQYVDNAVANAIFDIAGDNGTDTYSAAGTLTFTGGTGLTSFVTDDQVLFSLDSTSVTSGSYGSVTQIPTFTVDAQGRLTAASNVNVATTLTVNSDPISILDSDLTFTATGNGLTLTYTASTNTVNYAIADATTSSKGVAQFLDSDFDVSSGIASLGAQVLQSISTDSGDAVPSNHNLSIIGNSIQGTLVEATGSTITVEGINASTSQKGVASFASSDFDVTGGGEVSINSISNSQIDNPNVTIGDTQVDLGTTITNLTGLTGITVDNIRIDGNTISTNTSTPNLILDPKGGDSAGGKVVIFGDLQVNGTTTTINSTEVTVNDLTLTLADSAADGAAANGAGIIIDGANAQFTYANSGDKWTFNKDIDVTTGSDLTAIMIGGTTLREHIEDHLGNTFFIAGEGMNIVYGSAEDSDNAIIFDAEIATYTNKGVASFDSDQFTLTSGFVTVAELDGGIY